MASSPPKKFQGWIDNALPFTTITDAWVGKERSSGNCGYKIWLWRKWIQLLRTSVQRQKIRKNWHNLWVPPKKTLRFTEESSIFKESSVSKRKPIDLTQPYFWPRSNLKSKKKKGIFRTMVFKKNLQLSIPFRIRRNRNKIIGSLDINLEIMLS